MKRRPILLGIAAAPFLLAPQARPHGALTGLFSDLARARALGGFYLGQLPRRPAPDELAGPVWRRLSGLGSVRAQVAELIQDDFAAGRIACLNGWLVSLTEARLCGLAALA